MLRSHDNTDISMHRAKYEAPNLYNSAKKLTAHSNCSFM